MRVIDELYTEDPSGGSRRITEMLKRMGYEVNRKRIQRLMQIMGIKVIYPRPNVTKVDSRHRKYPYLLKGLKIESVNHVWSTDITYIPIKKGFAYLVAILDWFSRYILTWKLSNSLESIFCIEALKEALKKGKPKIFNSDQGVQFTCEGFIEVLRMNEIEISMDGRGRAFDNIFIERFWRTLKYEEVYCKEYESLEEANRNLDEFIKRYNNNRLHQALGYRTPNEIYMGNKSCVNFSAKFV